MKGFVVLLLCLFCLFCVSGCGSYTLEGTWKVNPLVEVEFRSDGSILAWGQKAEGLSWHGDYICQKVDLKKMRDDLIRQLPLQIDAAVESCYNNKLDRKSKGCNLWIALGCAV